MHFHGLNLENIFSILNYALYGTVYILDMYVACFVISSIKHGGMRFLWV